MFDFSLCFRHNPFDRFFAGTRLDNLLVFLLPQPHFDAALCCNATHPVFEEKEHIWLFVFLQGVQELGKKQPYPA